MKIHWNRLTLAATAALALVLSMAVPALRAQTAASAGSEPATPAQLTVSGDVEKPLSLSLDALKRLPRVTVNVKNEHAAKDEAYEGTPLAELIKQAGVPQGARLRGKAMATYVVAEGSDGYKVIFSLAELDADFADAGVIVADTVDGKPLDEKLGPLRLVAPHDKRPARWVRMLRSIQVVNVAK
jgi:DMSO/TMAO reductase YedYZ molybdopterin-dependent catalytic subunit